MTTFFVYLLQSMTDNDSMKHQKFLILIFSHEYQETPHPVFTSSKSTMETPEQCEEYVQS